MQNLVFFIYNKIVFPLILIIARIFSLYNKTVSDALNERKGVINKLNYTVFKYDKKILIHAASMGEFEHIKPLIQKLNSTFNVSIIVTFFSPSGYNQIKSYPGVELFLYLPLDTPRIMKEFYNLLNPILIILSKHDAWPNQIKIAKENNIPVYLINASLSPKSKRIKGLARNILKYVYAYIDKIYTISEEDMVQFRKHFPVSNIKKIGDTKFDQVLFRKEESAAKNLLSEAITKNAFVIVFGSIWEEGFKVVKHTVLKLVNEENGYRFIFVPHDPSEKIVSMISDFYGKSNCIKYSEIERFKNQKILIIDVIGILADLYKYAQIAYVGGGFKQGIHNVMEPAVYGIPVLYGPVIENSSEAIRLNKIGGSYIIHSAEEFQRDLYKLISDEKVRKNVGLNAESFVYKNTGATQILIEEWSKILLN